MAERRGVLCIGDPHLASRVPGYRRDDYPAVVLEKLAWCLDYARREALLPAILGDLFHLPRDNGNALVVRLMELFEGAGEILAIAGNHDVAEARLEPADTLSILVAARRVRLLDRDRPWRGVLGGREVAIGGTDWGEKIPERVDRREIGAAEDALVIWLTHHDVRFAGYEEHGRIETRELPGVDVVVNGHIHRPLEPAARGRTTWLNPGNIARVKRGDGSRRAPAALRIEVEPGAPGFRATAVAVPHRPYDEVFHPELAAGAETSGESTFVANMAALLAAKTGDGAGIFDFLDHNLGRYPAAVAAEVRRLAKEVVRA